jgi:uncharacterized membrane protein YqhA
MFERLLRIRYLAVVIVLFASLHAIGFLVIGVAHAIRAYVHLAQGHMGGDEVIRPGLEMLQSLDSMIIALVLVVFAAGTAKIFLLSDSGTGVDSKLPGWLRIHSFHELETLLWETILLAMLVAGLPLIAEAMHQPEWNMLILPLSILILAVSLFFVRRKE